MRPLLVFLLVLCGTVFLGYPPLIEAADSECGALDLRLADMASQDDAGRLVIRPVYGAAAAPTSATVLAQERLNLPPAVTCALAYWRSLFAAPATAARGTAPETAATTSAPGAAQAAARAPASIPASSPASAPASTIARDITPNGDPISPDTTFTLPMPSVAVRVDDPAAAGKALRFDLIEGHKVLSSCKPERSGPDAAWCAFKVDLRKGYYTIALAADNRLVGDFPFTVIGR